PRRRGDVPAGGPRPQGPAASGPDALRGVRDVRGRGVRDADDAPPPAPLRRLLRQFLLERGPAPPLPHLDVLGGTGRIVPVVVPLGLAHRALRLEERQGAGSARPGRVSSGPP